MKLKIAALAAVLSLTATLPSMAIVLGGSNLDFMGYPQPRAYISFDPDEEGGSISTRLTNTWKTVITISGASSRPAITPSKRPGRRSETTTAITGCETVMVIRPVFIHPYFHKKMD